MKRFSLLLTTVFSFSLLFWSCDKDDDNKPIPVVVKPDPAPKDPELKITFGDQYDDLTNHALVEGEVESNIQVSWQSKLPKANEIESDVYSFFHLKFQVQKKETEEVGTGNIWGFTGCAFECPEFATLEDYIEFEKADLVLARKQKTEIWDNYTDPVFVERQEDVTINEVVFAVVDFTVKSNGTEIYNRNYYHRISATKFVIVRVETVFAIADLWPEVVAEITSTVDSLKVEVIEKEEEGGDEE